jgi:branched-chain amino acid transport system permease protein
MGELAQNIIDALNLGSIYALVALGLGLLYGILRLVNFAHGDFITVGCYALIVPSADATARVLIGSWSWPALIASVCLILVIVALLADALAFRPLRRSSEPTLMIASFAVGYIIQNAILLVYGSRPKAVNLWSALDGQIEVGALRVPLLPLVTIAVTLSLMIALTLFLKRTALGIQMRAAADDFRMAQYLGVKGNIVIGLAFAISGLLAAAVSLLFVTQSGALSHRMGVPLQLFALVAVVVGGMGSLPGAVIGGFFIGGVATGLQAYLPSELRPFRDAFTFGIVILVLLFRPSGIVRVKSVIERV